MPRGSEVISELRTQSNDSNSDEDDPTTSKERRKYNIFFLFFMITIFILIFAVKTLFIILIGQESGGLVHITQLIQQSVLPIARVGPNVKQLTINEIPNTQIFPIYFNISNCDDIRIENTTIYEEGILTPEENTPIYKLYAPYKVFLRLQIQVAADYNSSECPIVLVVFANVDEYKSFFTMDLGSSPIWSTALKIIISRSVSCLQKIVIILLVSILKLTHMS